MNWPTTLDGWLRSLADDETWHMAQVWGLLSGHVDIGGGVLPEIPLTEKVKALGTLLASGELKISPDGRLEKGCLE